MVTLRARCLACSHWVRASIRMKSYLQGAPELRLGLSEDLGTMCVACSVAAHVCDAVVGRSGGNVYGATVVDDITFHQACNLGDFERDRVIAMQAPEGTT